MRVIDYRLEGIADAEPIYRLVTTILDPERVPAHELAALYHERWEIEIALDELKTHLRGAKIVLRSKTPPLVRQEFYGLMMAPFAIRSLIHEAALKADDRLSCLHAVRFGPSQASRRRRCSPLGTGPGSLRLSSTKSFENTSPHAAKTLAASNARWAPSHCAAQQRHRFTPLTPLTSSS